jgi:hypothetical protein
MVGPVLHAEHSRADVDLAGRCVNRLPLLVGLRTDLCLLSGTLRNGKHSRRPSRASLVRPSLRRLEAMTLPGAQGYPGTTSLASWAFASSYISSEGVFIPNQTVTFRSRSPTIVSTRHSETCGAG